MPDTYPTAQSLPTMNVDELKKIIEAEQSTFETTEATTTDSTKKPGSTASKPSKTTEKSPAVTKKQRETG